LVSIINFAVGNPSASERTRHNKFYQMRAMHVLGVTLEDDTPEAYLWIWGKPNVPRSGDHRVKWTVLAELGRFEDEELMREVAVRICELKLTTRDALRRLRQFRTGRIKSGDALELANAVIATINDYMNTHAGLSADDILDALNTASASVRESKI
jgi:hypothetical protein